jgi:hypothetical protein
MASDFSAIGAVDAGAYEIETSGGEATPGRGRGAGVAATGAAWVIGTIRGSGACAAMSIRTRRAVGSAAWMRCGPTTGDAASDAATRQTATEHVRILFPMASLSVARGLIRSG